MLAPNELELEAINDHMLYCIVAERVRKHWEGGERRLWLRKGERNRDSERERERERALGGEDYG